MDTFHTPAASCTPPPRSVRSRAPTTVPRTNARTRPSTENRLVVRRPRPMTARRSALLSLLSLLSLLPRGARADIPEGARQFCQVCELFTATVELTLSGPTWGRYNR
eukprot:9485985-Pyramimonas_sp.AAC.1